MLTPQAVESNIDSHNVSCGREFVIFLISDPRELLVGTYSPRPGRGLGPNRDSTKLVFEEDFTFLQETSPSLWCSYLQFGSWGNRDSWRYPRMNIGKSVPL